MTTTPTWNALKSQSQSSTLPVLGSIVTWRVRGCSVTQRDLERRLRQSGLDSYIPKPPAPRVALRRAIIAWVKSGHSPSVGGYDTGEDDSDAAPRKALIRYISTNKEWLTFGLILETVDRANLGLDYDTELRVFLNTHSDRIILSTDGIGQLDPAQLPPAHPSAPALEAQWRHFKELHIAGDLSHLILRAVNDLSSMPLRHEGGVYFVPQANSARLVSLRTFVEGLANASGQLAYLIASPVIDEKEARRGLAQALHAGFMDQIATFESDFRDLRTKSTNTRQTTVEERIVQYRRFREKVETYADLLAFQQDDIRHGIAKLRAQALAALDDGLEADESDSRTESFETDQDSTNAEIPQGDIALDTTEKHISAPTPSRRVSTKRAKRTAA